MHPENFKLVECPCKIFSLFKVGVVSLSNVFAHDEQLYSPPSISKLVLLIMQQLSPYVAEN